MADELEQIKRDPKALRAALEEAGAIFTRATAFRCPFHEDKQASGSIFQRSGHWLFRCHVCGAKGSVVDAIALHKRIEPAAAIRELTNGGAAISRPVANANGPKNGAQPDRPPQTFPTIEAALESYRRKGTLARIFEYEDAGEVYFAVARIEEGPGKKRFLQLHRRATGWQFGKPSVFPLYRQKDIEAAENIVVVEGEKAADAIADFLPPGWAVTTSPGGAGKAGLAGWSRLSGKEIVVLWPDKDDPGQKHMIDVARIVVALPNPPGELRRVDIASLDLGPKGDAADWVANRKDMTPADVTAALGAEFSAAPSFAPAPVEAATAATADTTTAHLRPIGAAALMGMVLPPVDWLVEGLIPPGLALMVADPKTGKTRWATQAGLAVAGGTEFLGRNAKQGRVLYVSQEEPLDLWQERLRQFEPCPDALDNFDLLCFDFPTMDRGGLALLQNHRKTHPNLRLIVLDTWGLCRPGKTGKLDAYSEDLQGVAPLRQWVACESGLTVLLLHHRKKSGGGAIQGGSGSLALPGTADAVYSLERANGILSLNAIGRRLREVSLALSDVGVAFRDDGPAEEVLLSDTRRKIKQALPWKPEDAIGPTDIAAVAEIPLANVKSQLVRMAKQGEVLKGARGRYYKP